MYSVHAYYLYRRQILLIEFRHCVASIIRETPADLSVNQTSPNRLPILPLNKMPPQPGREIPRPVLLESFIRHNLAGTVVGDEEHEHRERNQRQNHQKQDRQVNHHDEVVLAAGTDQT